MAKSRQQKKFLPNFSCMFSVECCGQGMAFEFKHEAMKWLLQHIRHNHPSVLKQVKKIGRELARSMNGMGYYDGIGPHSKTKKWGWFASSPEFREAWTEKAVEKILKNKLEGVRIWI